jgi:hypothetical protein
MANRTELTALKKLLSETDLILSTTELPENRTARCREEATGIGHPNLNSRHFQGSYS